MRSRRVVGPLLASLTLGTLVACGRAGDSDDAAGRVATTAATPDSPAPSTSDPSPSDSSTAAAAPDSPAPSTSDPSPSDSSTAAAAPDSPAPSTSVVVPPLTAAAPAPTPAAAAEPRRAVQALAGVPDVDGVPFDIDTVTGRDVLLWFWAPW